VKIPVKLIKADMAPIFGAAMSVFDWVSLPKLRLTTVMEKMLNSISRNASRHHGNGFAHRLLSGSGGQMAREIHHMPIPVRADKGLAFSHHHKPLSHNNLF